LTVKLESAWFQPLRARAYKVKTRFLKVAFQSHSTCTAYTGAAEEEARQLAVMMRAHGFGTPLGSVGGGGGGEGGALMLDNILGDEAGDGISGGSGESGGGRSGGGGGMMTPSVGPAALLFASPLVSDRPLDCIATPAGGAGRGQQPRAASGGGGEGRRSGGDNKDADDDDDDDFEFGIRRGGGGRSGRSSGSNTSASTATLFHSVNAVSAGASETAADTRGRASLRTADNRAYLHMSVTSTESLTGSILADNAARVIQSVAAAPEEATPTSGGSGGGGGGGGDSSGGGLLSAALTPSGAAAEGAAAAAMAGMDHPTLVAEAAHLVAANVRLERERRALVARLERAEASAAAANASVANSSAISATPAPPAWAVTPTSNNEMVSTYNGQLALTPPEIHDVVNGQAAVMGAMVERTEQLLQLASSPPEEAAGMTLAPYPHPATPGAMPGVRAMMLPAGTPGTMLTPGGNAAAALATPRWEQQGAGRGDYSTEAAAVRVPESPPSWDMCGTEFAVAQMTEALERVQAAASEAASLLDPGMDEDGGGGGSPGGSGSTTSSGSDGGKVNRAMRRKQRAGVDPAVAERRRRAHALALEAAQAAALASMQREHLIEVLAVEREQAKADAVESFTAMQRALRHHSSHSSMQSSFALASTPASQAGADITIGDAIVTPPVHVDAPTAASRHSSAEKSSKTKSTSPPPAAAASAAADGDARVAAASARADAAERELAHLRRQLAAAGAKAEEERTELQYRAVGGCTAAKSS
jgi:hypothetical protein